MSISTYAREIADIYDRLAPNRAEKPAQTRQQLPDSTACSLEEELASPKVN
jgi:hypothetical protein